MDVSKRVILILIAVLTLVLAQNCGQMRSISRLDSASEVCLNSMTTGRLAVIFGEEFDASGRFVEGEAKLFLHTAKEAFELTSLGPKTLPADLNAAETGTQKTAPFDQQTFSLSRIADPTMPYAMTVTDPVSGTRSRSIFFLKATAPSNPLSATPCTQSSTTTSSTSSSTSSTTSSSTTTTSLLPPPGGITNTFGNVIPFSTDRSPQKVLVVRMVGPQSRPQDYSDQQVRDILFGDGTRGPSVREFYLQQTRRRMSFTEGRILGPVASTQNCFGDIMRVLAEAKATIESSLTAAEFAQYQQLVLTLPFHSPGNQCGWSFGTPQQPVDFFGVPRTMGVSWSIENTPVDSFAGVLAHELGHAVGLNHASGLEALNDPLKLKQIPMTLHQYYDFRNIMGSTDIHGVSLNAVQLERLDALASQQTLATNQPGEYLLKSLDSNWTAADVVHLKLPMTLGDGVFFLRPFLSVEYRTLETLPARGLYIRTSNLASQSALFFWNGAESVLTAPGQAFTDENNGRRITLLALDATTARVRIEAIPQVGLPPVEQLTVAPVDLNTTQGCRTLKVRFRAPATSGLQVSGTEERPYPAGRWFNGCEFRPTNPAINEYGCEIPIQNDPPYQDVYITMSKSTPMPAYGPTAVLNQQQFYPIGSWSCR